MTAVCRVFFLDATITLPSSAAGGRLATDSISVLKWPYIARDAITATTASAQSCDAAPAGTRIAHVMIQAGKSVYVEINPPNRTTAADADSPIFSGNQTFMVGEGWSLSFMETS